MAELYIGMISGTSMDAADAVLADFSGASPRMLASHSQPIPDALHQRLVALHDGPPPTLAEVMALDVEMGRLFAAAANTLLALTGRPAESIRAIGSHGQTVYHSPAGDTPTTVQIGDPNVIAEVTGIATVADLRRRDMAAGGEGAPLAPAFHRAFFRAAGEDRVVLNLGGIANVTLLPGAEGSVSGFDTGPANTLMDAWSRRHLGTPLDEHGRWAAAGKVHRALLDALRDDPYFGRPPPKSTGREHFNLQWLDRALSGITPTPDVRDVQATLCELSVATIADAITSAFPSCGRVLACGGGVHNATLMQGLRTRLAPRTVDTTAAYGLDPRWVEATAFAWLAKQTMEGTPVDLRAITGSRHPVVLGGVYAGGGSQISDVR
jgi:anhydro-N-acetylmuramic acid kinase